MAMVDQAAASPRSGTPVGRQITASIDRVDFRERIPVGALVTCSATVDYVGSSSMSVSIEVYSEIPSTGERKHTHTAHAVFVAIDTNGKPKRVPRLIAESEEEKARYERARICRERMRAAVSAKQSVPGDVVLVFGGGGVKAAAHVGAWRAVTEAGLRPIGYIGTSMGAVIAAAFASGAHRPGGGGPMSKVRAEDIARPRATAGEKAWPRRHCSTAGRFADD